MYQNTDLRYKQLPWTEVYRPYTLNDLCLPDGIKHKINNILDTKNIPNIIISGPSGIGKTCIIHTIALALYKDYYGEAVLELNSFDDKGIKFIQEDILTFCKTKIPYKNSDKIIYPKYKLIIFDEVDRIIDKIQDQINHVITKYSDNIRFAFTCNMTSEISEAIQSNCLIWRYTFLPDDLIVKRLKFICEKESVKFTEKSLYNIASISCWDMRTAINQLQVVYVQYNEINEEYIKLIWDTPSEIVIKNFFKEVINKDFKKALNIVFELKNIGYTGSDIMLSMFSAMKSDTYNDIPENIKIKLCEKICYGIYQISDVTDSDLQIAGSIIDMVNCI